MKSTHTNQKLKELWKQIDYAIILLMFVGVVLVETVKVCLKSVKEKLVARLKMFSKKDD